MDDMRFGEGMHNVKNMVLVIEIYFLVSEPVLYMTR